MSSSRKIRKAVIPSAGLGTRMLPFTKAIPKEMMPLVNTPVMQYVVGEAVASGIETIVFVVNDSKAVLQKHFGPAPELVGRMMESGRLDAAESMRQLSRMAEIRFVQQPEALGVGHAIACAASEIGDEPFAVLLPDNIIDSAVPCIRQLMDCYEEFPGCVVAGREIDPASSASFGVLLTEPVAETDGRTDVLKVTDLIEKPAPGTVSGNYGVYGRYVLGPDIFSCLARVQPPAKGEFQITDALSLNCREGGAVYMLKFEGDHYDTGDKLGYLKANIAFALKDPKIAPQLQQYLRELAR